MKYELLENPGSVRRAFEDRFVCTWEEFQAEHANFIARCAEHNYTIDRQWHRNAHLWDKLHRGGVEVSFADALEFLRKHPGPALVLSDEAPEVILRADAPALADRAQWEWFEDYRLQEEDDRYLAEALLEEDTYICDEAMTWLVVLTHEDNWQLTDLRERAESRYCLLVQ